MELPEFPSFRNLASEDKPMLDSLLRDLQPQISELTFTNLFAWNRSERVELSGLSETVLLKRRRLRDATSLLLPPLGKKPLTDVLKTLRTEKFKDYQVPRL